MTASGGECGDPIAEHSGGFLGCAVDRDPLHLAPLRGGEVGVPCAAAECHDLVAGPYQAGDQVGSDVAGGADDDYPAHRANRAVA